MKQLRHLTSILMILLIVALSAGTVIEKLHDSDYAASHIYSAWWFIALWAAFAAIGAVLTFRNKNWKRPAVLTLFLSVACILLGALLTVACALVPTSLALTTNARLVGSTWIWLIAPVLFFSGGPVWFQALRGKYSDTRNILAKTLHGWAHLDIQIANKLLGRLH